MVEKKAEFIMKKAIAKIKEEFPPLICHEHVLREDLLKASKKIEHFLNFIAKVDTENALLENCFGYINQQTVLLKVMSEFPCEAYLELCERRYGKKAS